MKLLTIGNFIKRKRIWLVADAFLELQKAPPFEEAVEWLVIGNGPHEHTHDRVTLSCCMGAEHKPYEPDLIRAYEWADVFVLPSVDEAFGMVYAEAIAHGCPVICTAGDGGAWIVEQTGGGLAVELWGSHANMVEKLAWAISHVSKQNLPMPSAAFLARCLVDENKSQHGWQQLMRETWGTIPTNVTVTKEGCLA